MSDAGHAPPEPPSRGRFAVAAVAEAAWLVFLAWMAFRGG